jgi:hypothetical protein
MNVTRKILLLSALCLVALASQAQTSLNLYPLNGTVGMKFFSSKKVSLEPRLDFQFDHANGESNLFMNTEIFTTINFLQEDRFKMYSGVGLGANIYNQAQSNFSGTVPFGATYYLMDSKRMAFIGECGMKVTAYDFVKIKSYALIGIQISLKKAEEL